jgi:hypothetical protein
MQGIKIFFSSSRIGASERSKPSSNPTHDPVHLKIYMKKNKDMS